MAEERHLSPGDAKQTKVVPPVEHEALEKILPVDNGMKNHFQFNSF